MIVDDPSGRVPRPIDWLFGVAPGAIRGTVNLAELCRAGTVALAAGSAGGSLTALEALGDHANTIFVQPDTAAAVAAGIALIVELVRRFRHDSTTAPQPTEINVNKYGQAITQLLLVALIGIVAYTHFYPIGPGVAAPDGVRLGKAYAPVILSTCADAWDAAASDVASGTDMKTAQAAFATRWQAARVKAFDSTVAPSFDAVLPAGSTPTPAQRAAVASLMHDFAKGLRK